MLTGSRRAGRLFMMVATVGLLGAAVAGCPDDPTGPDTTWTEAFDASDDGWLLNVWGPSADRLWAVGGTPTKGAIVAYQDGAWAPASVPVQAQLLNWTTGFGPNDVYVAGSKGLILHYDGATWTPETTPTQQNLWGIWGANRDDMWAVGGEGRNDGDATVLRKTNGAWQTVTIPALQRAQVRAFFKVWGTSADDVYIVGQNGAVLHWDGAALTEVLVGASDDLIAVWGTGPDRIAMVGGRGNAIVTTWNGTEWRSENLAPLPGLNGVWMRNDGVIHAVGTFGTLATIDFDTLEWTMADVDVQQDFHAIFGDDSGRLTAVGGSLRAIGGPYEGLAWTRELADDE